VNRPLTKVSPGTNHSPEKKPYDTRGGQKKKTHTRMPHVCTPSSETSHMQRGLAGGLVRQARRKTEKKKQGRKKHTELRGKQSGYSMTKKRPPWNARGTYARFERKRFKDQPGTQRQKRQESYERRNRIRVGTIGLAGTREGKG